MGWVKQGQVHAIGVMLRNSSVERTSSDTHTSSDPETNFVERRVLTEYQPMLGSDNALVVQISSSRRSRLGCPDIHISDFVQNPTDSGVFEPQSPN